MIEGRRYIIAVAAVLAIVIGAYYFYHKDNVYTKVKPVQCIDTTSPFLKELSSKMSQLSAQGGNGADNVKHQLEEILGQINGKLIELKSTKKEEHPREEPQEEHLTKRELEGLELNRFDIQELPQPDSSEMNDKWIVVTSIFGPTEDIKKLAKIPGWKLVVVGDKKTPKDWKLDGVVFLSIKDQWKLGFETVKYLKYGVYQRKNMGFLYAIQHGAKYIYDTDDDNHPYGGKVTFDDMTVDKEYLMYDGNQHFYNGFAHFGQSTLWPRGYPLNMIDKKPVRTYKKCKSVRPLVQQGVVDGDPDLDAIQRLTRKDNEAKFVVYFDKDAPPVVLPPNSFVPYNSQNTFHHYDAFFALLLPQTVTFRVNDIWRSFITQRLLWDIGGHLAYFPPNAYQDRTPHDFLKDFYEEDDLYKNTNPLTKLLLNWKGKTKADMFDRHYDILKEMYKADIIGARDVRLGRAWVRDLLRIGYKPPALKKPTAVCAEKQTTFIPKEMPSLFLRIGQKTVNVVKEAKKLPLTKERERD